MRKERPPTTFAPFKIERMQPCPVRRFLLPPRLLSAVLFAAPAQALRADVQAAVDAVERLRANDAKIQEYCAIQAEIEDAGEDENKLDAAFEKLDTFFEELGDDYAAMFAVEGELEPDSEDAKALDDAFAALDGECGA